MSDEILKFDDACGKLSRQVSPATQYLAYLEYLSDNDDAWVKYKDSISGNIIKMNIMTAENALVLFCSRMFDSLNNAVSLVNQAKFIRQNQNELDRRRSEDWDALAYDDEWQALNEQRKQDLLKTVEKLAGSEALKVLKVMRHENLAHLIIESRDRKKNPGIDFDNHDLTRKRFFEFARDTIQSIERVELYRIGRDPQFDEMHRTFTGYSELFWNALPVFRDVE